MVCQVEGVGSIKIKLENEIVKTFSDVRFVPELKMSSISLDMLDQLGYNFKAKDEILTVAKGVMVLMKGLRQNGSYTLQVTTSPNQIGFSISNKIDKTKIWHMRLGHISERIE